MATPYFVTKQLADLLQEEQEPFTLEIYLIERGYPKNEIKVELNTSSKLLKNKIIIPNCSKAVRDLFNKVGYLRRIRIREKIIKKRNKSSPKSKAEDTFPSTSRKNGLYSCTDDNNEEEQVDADMKMQRGRMEENMQLSPVSVLEETFSENSPMHNGEKKTTTKHKEITNASETLFSEYRKLLESLKIKLSLQQTKHLLFDCVKEIVETQTSKNQQFCESIEAEGIGSVMCENIWEWSQKTTHTTNIKQLLELDVLVSAKEWSLHEQQRKGVGMEITDAILSDICSEIVLNML